VSTNVVGGNVFFEILYDIVMFYPYRVISRNLKLEGYGQILGVFTPLWGIMGGVKISLYP